MAEQDKRVLTNIMTILATSSADELFIQSVLSRLASFGIVVKEDDGWLYNPKS